MTAKRVIVSFHPDFYRILHEKAQKEYMNVQDLILDTMRKSILKQKKPGRPPKAKKTMEDYLTR